MSKVNKAALNILNKINEVNNERQLKHLLPRSSIEIRTIGNSLTDLEWEKFSNRYLIPKLKNSCERKLDGPVIFYGELGLDAALILQQKYFHRFHFNMICDTQENAALALYLAERLGLKISELHYKNGRNEMVNINDKSFMDKLIQRAAMIGERQSA